ncbi:phage tail tape measure protein [Clostridium baratii]|uniref:phage tail tape measure protein n=1 Tax=Clostridium baratii TaxID=1561 RepID=UPI003D79FCA3
MSDLEKRITAKMILDDSGYSSKLKGINAELKNNQAQFKLASASVSAFGKDTEKLKSVQEALSRQTELQSKKIALYKESIEKTSTKMQENINTRDKLKQAIEQEKSKLDSLKKTYGENNEVVRNSKDKIEKLKEQLKDSEKTVENNARAIQNYDINLNKANAQLVKAQGELNKVNDELSKSNNKWITASQKLEDGSKKFDDFGKKAKDIGGTLTTHVSMPLLAAGAAGAKVGMDFEAEMSRVKAISGATGEEFEQLENQALSLGKSTAFSAGECAEGMENLASAGFSVKETMQAMPGLLDLAASSGEDLAMSSEIAAGTLRGFGLEADKAGHVADVLAKNAADTNAAVADTGEAMKYVAPAAHAAGQSLEQVTAAIGIMSNANIKGSQAGTTLRASLTRLAKPSEQAAKAMDQIGFKAFDAKGKMLPLDGIIRNLQKSTQGLTDKQKQAALAAIFGQESLSGMLTLVSAGPDQLNELTNSLKNSDGAASKMARTMQDNTKSSIEQAFGALETASIKALKVAAPAIKSIADDIGSLADKFSSLSPETQEMILKFGLFAVAAGPVISVIGKLSTGIGGVISVAGKLAGAIGGTTAATTAATAATSAAAVATEGAAVAATGVATATGGLLSSFLAVAAPAAAVAAGVAAVGYAGYKTYKYLNESATPAVDLFADKAVYSTEKVMTAHGQMTTKVQTDTIKISKSTKDAVQSYLDMDKKASNSLMDLRMNSDKFTKEAKDKVLKNFTDMSKKSSKLSNDQRNAMTVNFKKLISDTGTLTKKNKDEIIKQYTAMVNGTKKLSDKQKKQIIKDFTDTLNNSTSITKKQSQDLQKLYKDMGGKIKLGLDKKKNDELKSLKDFFGKSNALTVKEEADILKKTSNSWNNKKKTIDDYQKQIDNIIQNAAKNHRQITNDEAKSIDEIQKKMRENAVKTLSDNEVQSKVILERMKDYDGNITTEQASEHIKKLNDLRDNSVNAAKDECDKRIAEIIRMRDDSKVISADQAEKLIADANKQKKETIQAAEDTRKESVNKITSMNSNISSDVDTTTGEVLTNWDKIKNWWNNFWPDPKQFKMETIQTSVGGAIPKHWTGTSYFKGGFTTLHERGEELYDLPSGTRIYNHEMSEEMVLETARKTAQGVINNMLNDNEGNNGDIIIPINIAGEEIDRIVVPRVSSRLALNTLGRR